MIFRMKKKKNSRSRLKSPGNCYCWGKRNISCKQENARGGFATRSFATKEGRSVRRGPHEVCVRGCRRSLISYHRLIAFPGGQTRWAEPLHPRPLRSRPGSSTRSRWGRRRPRIPRTGGEGRASASWGLSEAAGAPPGAERDAEGGGGAAGAGPVGAGLAAAAGEGGASPGRRGGRQQLLPGQRHGRGLREQRGRSRRGAGAEKRGIRSRAGHPQRCLLSQGKKK
ncbi:PREDICTED: translation initiation factor IF-2-like [Calidris pugnax]|uniref:translation initiation factor IF-2-like n=1 Tax=Calidris pugnax TaxID=198806 RepID=UPI00071C5F81|nr:PREDICTED: translation initiation factor IF-2-like [Calidris pugnax]